MRSISWGAVGSSIGSFVLVILVANGFSKDQAGELFTAVSALLIAVGVVNLGTDTGLARFIPHYIAERRSTEVRATVHIAGKPVAIATFVMSAATLAFAGVIAAPLGLGDSTGPALLRMFALALPFATLSEFWLGCTRAFGRMRPSVLLEDIGRTVLQIAAVLLAVALSTGILPLAFAVGGPVRGHWFARRCRRNPTGARSGRVLVAPCRARASATSVASSGGTRGRGRSRRVGQIALQRLDIVLVAAILGPAGSRPVHRRDPLRRARPVRIPRPSNGFSCPGSDALVRKGDIGTISDVFKISTAWSILVSWPLYLVAACAAPLYLKLFGSGYSAGAVPVVVTMAIAMMLAIASGPLDTLLLMAGKSGASLAIMLVSLGIDVAVNLAFLPHLGIFAAALAWGLAVVTRNVLAFWQLHRVMAVTPLSRAGAFAIVASVACFAVPLLAVDAAGVLDFGLVRGGRRARDASLCRGVVDRARRARAHCAPLPAAGKVVRGSRIVCCDEKAADGTVRELARPVRRQSPGDLRTTQPTPSRDSPDLGRQRGNVAPGRGRAGRPSHPRVLRPPRHVRLLVSNDIISKHLVKGPRVHYLQTWHGTPLKVIGHDEKMPAYDNAKDLARQDRDVRKWDALLSSGPECTAMFRSAFRFDGEVLEVGYPRNDVLRSAEAPSIRERVRRDLGLEESATAVLYAPTWRDDVQRPDGTFGDPGGLDVDGFTAATGEDTVVLMRMHSVVSTRRSEDATGRVLDVSDHPDIAELYLAADVLVSDYSSAIYDFAVTGKPIVLFAYDLEHYRDGIRGMYLDYEEWAPGPIVTTVDELAATVTAVTLPGCGRPGRTVRPVRRPLLSGRGRWRDRQGDRPVHRAAPLSCTRATVVRYRPGHRVPARGRVDVVVSRSARASSAPSRPSRRGGCRTARSARSAEAAAPDRGRPGARSTARPRRGRTG